MNAVHVCMTTVILQFKFNSKYMFLINMTLQVTFSSLKEVINMVIGLTWLYETVNLTHLASAVSRMSPTFILCRSSIRQWCVAPKARSMLTGILKKFNVKFLNETKRRVTYSPGYQKEKENKVIVQFLINNTIFIHTKFCTIHLVKRNTGNTSTQFQNKFPSDIKYIKRRPTLESHLC